MNEIVNADIKKEIAEKLANGETVDSISKELGCEPSVVSVISQSAEFLSKSAEILEKRVKLASLNALKNVESIANNEKASDATRLKASQFIIDKALEFSGLQGGDDAPSNMTQRQLIDRLKELQDEAINRAKPIDTGVLDLDALTE